MSAIDRVSRLSSPAAALAAACAAAFFLIAIPTAAGAPGGHGASPGKPKGPNSSTRQHHGKPAGTAVSAHAGDELPASSGVAFGRTEGQHIRRWFSQAENLRGLPPGLARRDSLPPGLRRQIDRNGELPPGLRSRLEPLPVDLESRLPRLPGSMRRVVVGRDVLLVESDTNRVRDILWNVLPVR